MALLTQTSRVLWRLNNFVLLKKRSEAKRREKERGFVGVIPIIPQPCHDRISIQYLLPRRCRPARSYQTPHGPSLSIFRGLFYDVNNDPEGGYYARGARAAVWENFKNNPLFDISTEHPTTYYKDMQRAIFCLCPLGWAPWSPRLVEAVVFGCIPVIIADDNVLPFADPIPWEEMEQTILFYPLQTQSHGTKWGFCSRERCAQLGHNPNIHTNGSYLEETKASSKPFNERAMLFPHPAQPGDAFHQILDGLARKLPHDKSVYLKPGEKIFNWTEGPVGGGANHALIE
ncbi:putative beta-1,4-xylosyltransferase irx10 [Turnera subulata]|uniref:Beta-1,4-xylosyltransferase irx10 n=1 Tax=Turnera subulata TaxID=218843 RepID=A0A9Q0GFG4_9ROSI|nr:putative beta-1,4-xylosyltransferase irx10 [Turnera subulata]